MNNKFISLQILRGLSALYVVFYHVYIIYMQPEYGSKTLYQDIAKHGFLGVCFFFVLSGFIICSAHLKDIGIKEKLIPYVKKRFIRVYPIYWFYLTAFIVAASLGFGYPDFSWNPINITSSYLLLPLAPDLTLPLKVAWTLLHEVMFYAAFATAIYFGRKVIWLASIWVLCIIFNFLFNIIPESTFFSVWNLYFIGGIFSYFLFSKIESKTSITLFVVSIIMLIFYTFLSEDISRIRYLSDEKNAHLHVLLIIAFSLFVSSISKMETFINFNRLKLLSIFGDASYSIYLVHSAAISLILILIKKFKLTNIFSDQLMFIIIFLTASLVGVLCHYAVERPFLSFFNNRSKGGKAAHLK
ncbi:acyltransferase family protein [Asticcacaulis excentricus]|uniref:Acyltransferase 3 n=1 Tax=Asticcacaulis excentricus (strain ATCC 15261 / DSM 4724 / KCTC 12464 / NCIMB 9791 / VKM B-1370 / CB 48) TaxID=573065 RepID=E8RM99_ASTEC|nr:acyltransferase [Asticcacaulis excentricus]ADU13850.1 acyltransferase 3 [Asticcacaulis excentricus CB 48]